MGKNIIFCADGTWNGPHQDDNHDNIPDPTNVYKLFLLLAGKLSGESLKAADEQEKDVVEGNVTKQVAKYLHGVGDSRNPLIRMMGGAFGSGIITRIVRGYTFISRNYEPGDDIFIIGFSRGAYTARALAGFIAAQGLLAKNLTENKEQAYRKGAEAWFRYRKTIADVGLLQRLAEYASDLPAFLSASTLKRTDLIDVSHIKAVAVWDTVGALGIPDYSGDHRIDDFKFTDTTLSDKVSFGLHAVSLDEQREDFTPTLWDESGGRDGIKQVLFPGAHSDVGGGYPTANRESELSDAGLKWMVNELSALGVKFSGEPHYDIRTYPGAPAHQPWRGSILKTATRDVGRSLIGHCSITARAGQPGVYPDPKAAQTRYEPPNMPETICSGGEKRICALCLNQ